MTVLTDWKCWRDPQHTAIDTHPMFGWPQCATCRAAPPYHERPNYLPELLLDVYVLTTPSSIIAEGSGIVGDPSHAEDRVLVHYEGWIHGARQYEHLDARGRWEAGLLHAAGRMVTGYPTMAAGLLPTSQLKKIGTYDPRTHRVEVEDEQALAAWIKE